MHPLAYAMTRTASDLGLDMSAWLSGLMVPAQLMVGPGKGKGRQQRRIKDGGGNAQEKIIDHFRGRRRKHMKETIVDLPEIGKAADPSQMETAHIALGHMSRAVRHQPRRLNRLPSMPDLPPVRGFAGKLVEKELARRRNRG